MVSDCSWPQGLRQGAQTPMVFDWVTRDHGTYGTNGEMMRMHGHRNFRFQEFEISESVARESTSRRSGYLKKFFAFSKKLLPIGFTSPSQSSPNSWSLAFCVAFNRVGTSTKTRTCRSPKP